MISDFYYNSHDPSCKDPFGAVTEGTKISFCVKAEDPSSPREEGSPYDREEGSPYDQKEGSPSSRVIMKYFRESEGNEDIKSLILTKEGNEYRGTLTLDKTGLWFYWFEVLDGDRVRYFGNSQDSLGGLAIEYGNVYEIRHFQITCHSFIKKSPAWYKNAIFYQIFPDRFYNGNEDGCVDNPKPGSFLYGSWYDEPYYIRNSAGGIDHWDFMGGNFKGIRKKIPYLKDLGITGIYLNPIFEARSCHRYDTGDYMKTDPMLGTEEEFRELCEELKENGIRIMLDGVFNHTGADSIYFNALSNYDSIGAANSKDSPYYSWYRFKNYPFIYDCWWGVTDLPNVNEEDPSYRNFITGKDGVIKKWIEAGASGWRLDVADELPDDFIRDIRKSMEEMTPSSGSTQNEDESEYVLIGEVWEDASNKIAYSKRREYLYGNELHGVMNYPFKDTLIRYLRGEISAEYIYRVYMSLYENYPPEAFYSSLNSLSTHDTRRIATELGGPEKVRMACAALFFSPGVPCIYYGDEAGLKGQRDPYNRAGFPWGREDIEYMQMYREMTRLRKENEVLTGGSYRPFFMDGLFGILRYGEEKGAMALVLNPSDEEKFIDIQVHTHVVNRNYRIKEDIPGRNYTIIEFTE